MNKYLEHWFSYSVILIWFIVWWCCHKMNIAEFLTNKGIAIIDRQYYRYATSLLLHSNFIHVLFNATALYFVCAYLEPQISPLKLLVFSMVVGVITEVVFSAVFRTAVSAGGSPIVFALIGLIVSIQIMKADYSGFQFGTWYGNWTLAYTILANIPFFSDNFVSTMVIHGLAFVLGIILGCVGIMMNII